MSRSRGTGNVTEVTGEDNHVDWSDPEIWTMIDDNQIGGRDGGVESCDAECEILTTFSFFQGRSGICFHQEHVITEGTCLKTYS